jgi:acetyl-CoA acetyltransferase
MPEAVIVDTIRTPIGRAFKGSLAQLRPTRWAPTWSTSCSSATPRSTRP